MHVVTVGVEVRHHPRSTRQGRRSVIERPEGGVILLHFLSANGKKFGLHRAHIGLRFGLEEDPIPHMARALEQFPVDGQDLSIIGDEIHPREQNGRAHRVVPAALWVPSHGDTAPQTGVIVGFGVTLEEQRGEVHMIPYYAVQFHTDRGPRNLHARLVRRGEKASFMPKKDFPSLLLTCEEEAEDGTPVFSGPGELPQVFQRMWEDHPNVCLHRCLVSVHQGAYVFEALLEEELVVHEPVRVEDIQVPSPEHQSTAFGQAFAKAKQAAAAR